MDSRIHYKEKNGTIKPNSMITQNNKQIEPAIEIVKWKLNSREWKFELLDGLE